MNRENIAKVAHQINLAYCASLGDTSQPQWEDAPDWQKQSALAGVDMHLANPDATPQQSHESWLAQKLADGWVYGETKDADAKTHPCCVPYDELPQEQKSKDYLFRATVHALRDEPDPAAALAPAEPSAVEKQIKAPAKVVIIGTDIGVRYVGRRESFVDNNYGSGLSFDQGQVRVLPSLLARKFLRHADQFEEAVAEVAPAVEQATDDDGTNKALEDAAKHQKEQNDELNAVQDVRDQVMHMNKKSLEEYALTKYQQKLDQGKKVGDLRLDVIGMIDRFGVV
jgi:hypothetical protein